MGDEPADANSTAVGSGDAIPVEIPVAARTPPLQPDLHTDLRTGGASDDAVADALPDARESIRAAFSAFYLLHHPRLVRFLVLDGAPTRIAADLAQDAMIDLFRRWETVQFPWAWVRKAASRAWIRYRTQVPELPFDDVELPLLISDSAASEIDTRHDLLRMLTRLSPRQRQVMARLFDGDTYGEIAAELQISEATVRSTARHARTILTTRRHELLAPGLEDGTER